MYVHTAFICYIVESIDSFDQVDSKWQATLDRIGVPPRPMVTLPLYRHNEAVEPILICTLAELADHAARLNPEALDPRYVGFDLELTTDKRIAYLQFSISDLETIIVKISDDLFLENVLQNPFIRALLQSEDISKVGVGIYGMLYGIYYQFHRLTSILKGDACYIFQGIKHPGQPIVMKNLIELSHVAQMYDSFALPTSQQTMCQRLLSPRDWFRHPRQPKDQIKLSVLVAHKLGEYLPKDSQKLDWGDPTQIGPLQLQCTHIAMPPQVTFTDE